MTRMITNLYMPGQKNFYNNMVSSRWSIMFVENYKGVHMGINMVLKHFIVESLLLVMLLDNLKYLLLEL